METESSKSKFTFIDALVPDFADILSRARVRQDFSYEVLQTKTGLSTTTIGNILKNRSGSKESVEKLAEVLEVPMAKLYRS